MTVLYSPKEKRELLFYERIPLWAVSNPNALRQRLDRPSEAIFVRAFDFTRRTEIVAR